MNALAEYDRKNRRDICRSVILEAMESFKRQNIDCPPLVLLIDDGETIWEGHHGTAEQAQLIIRHAYGQIFEKDVPPCHKKA